MSIRDRVTQFVTYLVKQVYCSKGGIVLGRVSGAGSAQEITVGSGLTLSGTTLAVTGGTFAAASHTHSLSNLTQSGAEVGNVATWSGTAWTPSPLSTSTGGNGVSDAGKLVKFDSSGAIIASWYIFPNSQSLDGKTISPLIYPPDYGSTTVGTGFESIYKLPLLSDEFPDTVLAKTSRTDGAVSYNDLVDVPAAVPLTASKVVDNAAARLALTTEQAEGFAVVDADTGKTWMLVAGGTPATSGDWLQLGDRDIQWGDVGGKPSTFSPSSHTHAAADITDASTSGKTVLTGTPAQANSALSSPVTNVKHYGATGDGVTNDTAAINLAKTAALASNHTLYFPAGTYLCNLELAVGEVLNFVGAGAGSVADWVGDANAKTILIPASDAVPVLWFKYLTDNCLIEGIEFRGNGAGTSVDGVKLETAAVGYPGGGLIIRQCVIRKFTNGFVNSGGTPIVCDTSAFMNCNKCVYAKAEGLTRTMRFSSCVFGGAVASGTGISFVNEGTTYALFDSCEIGNNAHFFENVNATSHCYITANATNFETHTGDWMAKTNGGAIGLRGCNLMMSNNAIEVIRTVGTGVTDISVEGCSISGITTGSLFATDGVFQSFRSTASANVRVYTDNTFVTVAGNGNALKYRAIYQMQGADRSITSGANDAVFESEIYKNVTGLYNTTTGVFTPGRKGVFQINTSIALTSGSAANVYIYNTRTSAVASAGYTSRISSMPAGSTISGVATIVAGSAADTFKIVIVVSSNTQIRCGSYYEECFLNITEL